MCPTHESYGFNRWARVPGEGAYTMENVAADLAKRNTLSFNFPSWHCPTDENGFAIFDYGDGALGCRNQILTPPGFPNGIKLDEYKKLNISKNDYRSNTASVYSYVISHDYETSFIIDGNFDIHVSALWPYSASSGNPPNSMGYANLDYLNTWHGKHVESGCLGCEVFGKNEFFC